MIMIHLPSTNADNPNKMINRPHAWITLQVSAIYFHPQREKKEHVALIILIIVLKSDVSTSCNEKIKINEMNKNCILFNLFFILFSSIEGSLWLHSGHVVVYTAILPLPWRWWFPVYLHSGHVVAYFRYGYGSRFSGWLPIPTKY